MEAPDDGRDFRARWRLLRLGDVNVVHAHTTPLRYVRDRAMIAADGHDAAALGVGIAPLAMALDGAGGLDALVERRRLLAAHRLLADPTGTAPVAVIARQCGFPDAPRFSRRFRALFGGAPRDVRHGLIALPGWAGAYPVEQVYGAAHRVLHGASGSIRLTSARCSNHACRPDGSG